jgi:hypothetical protein
LYFQLLKLFLIHLPGPFSAVPDTEMVGFSSGTTKFQPYAIVNLFSSKKAVRKKPVSRT